MGILCQLLFIDSNNPNQKEVFTKEPTNDDWAEAIAARISDESPYDFDDKKTLEIALTTALKNTPSVLGSLIGTGIIEEGYFEDTQD